MSYGMFGSEVGAMDFSVIDDNPFEEREIVFISSSSRYHHDPFALSR